MRDFAQLKSRTALLALCAGLLLSQVGCSTLMFWKNKDKKDDGVTEGDDLGEKSPKAALPKTATLEELELKLAKTWARVDELEEDQFRQKEKLRVLEKGLTLGILPEEMSAPAETGKGKKKKSEAKAVEEPLANDHGAASEEVVEVKHQGAGDAKHAKASTEDKVPLSKEDQEAFQKMLASAQDQYRAGKYGRAIVELSDINKLYGDGVEGGLPEYWIAKSWIGLKEYNTARQHLQEFIKGHASSPWIPRAKLDLAKIEWKLGLQETAINHFKEIIQAHPYEDAAEMAKMELSNLDKSL